MLPFFAQYLKFHMQIHKRKMSKLPFHLSNDNNFDSKMFCISENTMDLFAQYLKFHMQIHKRKMSKLPFHLSNDNNFDSKMFCISENTMDLFDTQTNKTLV